jgi:transcriptional regulator with PAS, ATPase and Fis domain
VRADVRVVSSTNRDLEAAIRAGGFREDLYYRLNVMRIQLPPLRERGDDVARLAAAFLAEFGRELGKGPLALAPGARAALARYAWPGNVRELRNLMERAAVLCGESEVSEALVGALLPPAPASEGASHDLESALNETERKAILRALAASRDDKAAAAALLGIGERTLWTKLKKHGL